MEEKVLEHTLQTQGMLLSNTLPFSSKKVSTISTAECIEAAKHTLQKHRTDWARSDETCLFPTRSIQSWTDEDHKTHAINIASTVVGWSESSKSRKDENHMDCFLARTALNKILVPETAIHNTAQIFPHGVPIVDFLAVDAERPDAWNVGIFGTENNIFFFGRCGCFLI